VVVDPFSDNCVVVTGSHNLGFTASYNNDENMAIIRAPVRSPRPMRRIASTCTTIMRGVIG
jgi:phosphatidylserine/phosphatidylglycerophosphate/cardiolipin synthase-like enzyme